MTIKEKMIVWGLALAVFGICFSILHKIDDEMMTECQTNFSFEYCQNHILR